MFDRVVNWDRGDRDRLQRFVAELMALDRKSYAGAIRAIRRYVVGTYRIADDVNLAYALFVMSIESLAQEFDKFAPVWADYAHEKRQRIDDALTEAPNALAENVRAAILANEHVAISRLFREFALAHIGPTFFRDEAVGIARPISRPDLMSALQQAYSIRSGYVHHLQHIPRIVSAIPGFHEAIMADGKPTLTFAGLARVARHVINTFIARAPKTDTEEFDWMKDLPGTLQMEMAAESWLSDPRPFDVKSAQKYLSAYSQQVMGWLQQPTRPLNDLRPVLAKIETLLPGLAKPRQRLPLLALYYIFNWYVPEDLRTKRYPALIEAYESDFKDPSFVSLLAQLVTCQNPDWTLPQTEELHARYFRQRHYAETPQFGRVLEAAFTLQVAEQNRTAGNVARARELLAFAVDACPENADLRSFEASIPSDEVAEIDWHAILLPATRAPLPSEEPPPSPR